MIDRVLETIQAIYRPDFEIDLRAAWKAVNIGVVDANARKGGIIGSIGVGMLLVVEPAHTWIGKEEDGLIILIGYVARVRSDTCGFGNKIGVQSVSDALGAISKNIEMGGKISPIYREPGKYLLPLERLIEVYRRDDPPPTPRLAVPVSVVEYIFIKEIYTKATAKLTARRELALIAMYFLFRVREYTATEMKMS